MPGKSDKRLRKPIWLIALFALTVALALACFAQLMWLNHANEIAQLELLGVYDSNKWILTAAQDYERDGCSAGLAASAICAALSGIMLFGDWGMRRN